MNTSRNNEEEEQRRDDIEKISWGVFVALLLGFLYIWLRYLFPGIFDRAAGGTWNVTGHAFISSLWGVAWFAAAFIFGFLFGIPKVLQTVPQQPSSSSATSDTKTAEPSRRVPYQLRVNTNLEEISDWLTKILVGATVTQLVKIPARIKDAAWFMSDGLSDSAGVTFSASILVYFSSIGFLSGYILTRTFLSRAFSRSDQPEGMLPSVDREKLENVSSERLVSVALSPTVGPDASTRESAKKSENIALTTQLDASTANLATTGAILAGNTDRALAAAKLALSKAQNDPNAHLNYAIALHLNDGDPKEIQRELETAAGLIPEDVDLAEKEDLYNSVVYFFLYLPAPVGFTKAIQYGEAFLKRYKPSSASIWVNLACAYAQQLAYLQQSHGSPEELAESRDKALSAVRTALTLDPDSRSRFKELLHGSADPLDDDLKVFENDPDFKQLIDG